MLSYFIRKAQPRPRLLQALFGPRVVVCVPSGVTDIELRAVREAARPAGARQAYAIEEPLAAAIGAGLPGQEGQGARSEEGSGGEGGKIRWAADHLKKQNNYR